MPRIVDHQQRRTELVRAVWSLIARSGLGAVTMRNVAAEAGVSVGRVQHYFASKDDLLRQACRAVIESAAETYAREHERGSMLERLRGLLVLPIPTTPAGRAGVVIWQSFLALSLTDRAVAELVAGELAGTRALAAELVDAARREGDLAGGPRADLVADALFALSHGLAQQVMAGVLDAERATAVIDAMLAS